MLEPIRSVSHHPTHRNLQFELSLRIDECLVHPLSFVVTSILLACLLLKSLSLVEWIVQLGVSVGQLLGGALS